MWSIARPDLCMRKTYDSSWLYSCVDWLSNVNGLTCSLLCCPGPTITGSSKIVVLSPRSAPALLTARQKLQLLGQPFHIVKVPHGLSEAALGKLAGNCQDPQVVSVMLLLTMAIVNWNKASNLGPMASLGSGGWCVPPQRFAWRNGALVARAGRHAGGRSKKKIKKFAGQSRKVNKTLGKTMQKKMNPAGKTFMKAKHKVKMTKGRAAGSTYCASNFGRLLQ